MENSARKPVFVSGMTIIRSLHAIPGNCYISAFRLNTKSYLALKPAHDRCRDLFGQTSQGRVN